MLYLIVKSLHLISLFFWVSGMCVQVFTLHFGTRSLQKGLFSDVETVRALIKYNRVVIGPAMLVAIGSGLVLAYQAGWFPFLWLQTKIPLVFFLAALHGIYSRKIKNLLISSGSSPKFNTFKAAVVLTVMLTAIVSLVVLKPF